MRKRLNKLNKIFLCTFLLSCNFTYINAITLDEVVPITLEEPIYDIATLEEPMIDEIEEKPIEKVIEPIIISFSVPQSISFTINPNEKSKDKFISPTFTIDNNSNVPLKVFVKNIESTNDSFHDFNYVSMDKYSTKEWSNLNYTKSMSEIALSLETLNNHDWINGEFFEPNDMSITNYLGTLDNYSSATVRLKAKHGNSFTKLKSTCNLTFFFEPLNLYF